jgi:hypothetical protein
MSTAIQQGGKVLAIVAGIAGVLAMVAMTAGAGARARDGVHPVVTSKVAVESRDSQVLATVTINNQTENTVFVPRVLAQEGEPEGNLFEVRDSSNGDPLDYVGMMVKRPAPTKKDFVPIKPHASLLTTFAISNSYRFATGRHAYQISLNGSYLTDLSKLEQHSQIEAPPVMFAHVGQ